MALIPVGLREDPGARGWKPSTGWYLYDTCKLEAVDLHLRFNTKTEVWREIAQRLGTTVHEARKLSKVRCG
jgi:hypothetical protein